MRSSENAKRLRREMTDAERVLWRHLRGHRFLGQKFRRQQPLGAYILDFVHFGAKLVVEADGGQHSECASDAARDAWLRSEGFEVLRFWNDQILRDTDAVLEAIFDALGKNAPSPPTPPPPGGRGEHPSRFEKSE
jgi:very-short-patch-repair endonuclease